MFKYILNNSFFKNFFCGILIQVSTFIFPVITTPLLTKKLGVNEFGCFSSVLSLIITLSVFCDFGFSIFFIKKVSEKRGVQKFCNKFLSIHFTQKTLFFAINLIFISCYFLSHNYSIVFFFLSFVSLCAISLQPNWLFQGNEKVWLVTFTTLVSRAGYFIVVLCLYKVNAISLNSVMMSYCFSVVLSLLISLVIAKKYGYSFRFAGLKLTKLYMKGSFEYFTARCALVAYSSSPVFIIGYLTSSYWAAQYAVAEQFLKVGQAFSGAISQALYPYMTRTRDKIFFRRIFVGLLVLLLIGASVSFLLFDQIIIWYVGSDFNDAIFIAKILMVVIVISSLSSVLGYPFLAVFGMAKYANRSLHIGIIFFYLFLLCCVIFNINVTGNIMALGLLFTELSVFSYRMYFSFKVIKNEVK